jgi:hypothetical protein
VLTSVQIGTLARQVPQLDVRQALFTRDGFRALDQRVCGRAGPLASRPP